MVHGLLLFQQLLIITTAGGGGQKIKNQVKNLIKFCLGTVDIWMGSITELLCTHMQIQIQIEADLDME